VHESSVQWQAVDLVEGRFRIMRKVGAGGMGEVYLAEDERLGRKVALKLLAPRFTADPDGTRRFEQEACAASALNHPNIMTVYDIVRDGSAHFIVAEFVEGESLRQRLAGGRMGVGEALGVATQVGDALSAVHRINVAHRDVKPENVMLRPDGLIKVLDFGLAKLTGGTPEYVASQGSRVAQVITRQGVVLGTPGYMSPEQACGERVDWRTDLFSLGVVLYEMVAGRRPFEGRTVGEVIASTLSREPPSLQLLAPEVPEGLQEIVSSALCKDRERRCQTAGELTKALRMLGRRLKGDQHPEELTSDYRAFTL
jgi:serine/threonine protein kinase